MVLPERRKEKIMVCLSPSPSNRRVIQAAERACGEGDSFLALFVGREQDTKEYPQLADNILFAEACGADVHFAEKNGDIAGGIAEFARNAGVTMLFIGYSAQISVFPSKSIPEKLGTCLPEVEIHVIPDVRASAYPLSDRRKAGFSADWRDILVTIGIMGAATLVACVFDRSRFSNSNIVTLYILGVLLVSVLTSHPVYGAAAALLYILLFNFLFIDPRFTLLVYDAGYLVTYLVSVIAALLTGVLASRLKTISRQSEGNAFLARTLLDMSKELGQSADGERMREIAGTRLSVLLKRPVSFGRDGTPEIAADGRPLSEFENMLVLSVTNELNLALENDRIRKEIQRAELDAEKERLKAGLLRSISHDLRTPLTVIYGSAERLEKSGENMTAGERARICRDIREDAFYLTSSMENILSISKIGNNTPLRIEAENVRDVIEESLRHADPAAAEHTVRIQADEDLFADMDAKLIVLVLVNLINNAIRYTPAGSVIEIAAAGEGERIRVAVSDDGDGIAEEDRPHIFEMFYTGSRKTADDSRSMGLGLNLCAMIIGAHGQEIRVGENIPHGTCFTFWLKASALGQAEEDCSAG